MALLQNEYAAYLIVVLLVLGIAIQKFYGIGKLIRKFTGSGERVEAARAAKIAKATTAKTTATKTTE